jgi:hypothetical protein
MSSLPTPSVAVAAPQPAARDLLRAANHAFLFLCTSMYLGTGWSLALFSFPIAPQLTVDTYYLQFVPQVTTATEFFTYMTMAMSAAGLLMLWLEWKTPLRWVPIVVLLGIGAATGMTVKWILPLNAQMAAHIADAATLRDVLERWMSLNRVRVGLWSVQWAAMMFFFARMLLDNARAAAKEPA